jgi:hypothetical protein
MNKRVLVLTGTSDTLKEEHYKDDNSMEEVFNLTLPSKQRYVQKHGYDLMSMRSFGTDTRHNIFKESDCGYGFIGFIRVLRACQLLEYYDYVMWIDADSIITNSDYSIDDFQIEDKYCFYASWDWPHRFSFSTGNFIVHKGEQFDEFLKTFVTIGKYIQDSKTGGFDQTTLNLMYRDTPFKQVMKILEHKFLGGVPDKKIVGSVWDGRPDPISPWTEDSFIAHLTGMTNKNRINVLQNSFKNYL